MSVLLAIDTATSTAVVALGDPRSPGTARGLLGGSGGEPFVSEAWRAGHRHGEELLPRVDAVLARASLTLAAIEAIVVGTGPGAFTGLRVGLATAKGLAHGLGRPLIGVSTGAAILAAAAAAGAPGPLALLLPAGPSDRVVIRAGSTEFLPAGREPDLPAGTTLVAVDLEGRAPAEAVEIGRRALAGLGEALLRIGAERLAAGEVDDVARVVPDYVTLPRGVREQTGEVAWSRDRR